MANKSQKQKYGEFRIFVEWMRRGKWRIRPAFVPSLAAWFLMMGKRYQKMADGMKDKQAIATIPGMEEAARTMDICVANIQRLMNMLTENFSNEDWQVAVAEICQLMHIKPDSSPLDIIPPDTFEHLIQEPGDGPSPR